MTKEGLGEEAEEYAIKNLGMTLSIKGHIEHAYFSGAEPREKKIKELEKKNAELNRKLSDIAEVFISASKNDDCEMAHCGREIMEMLIEQEK